MNVSHCYYIRSAADSSPLSFPFLLPLISWSWAYCFAPSPFNQPGLATITINQSCHSGARLFHHFTWNRVPLAIVFSFVFKYLYSTSHDSYHVYPLWAHLHKLAISCDFLCSASYAEPPSSLHSGFMLPEFLLHCSRTTVYPPWTMELSLC